MNPTTSNAATFVYDLTDPALLEANQAGTITDEQRRLVSAQVAQSGCVLLVLPMMLLPLLVSLGFVLTEIAREPSVTSNVPLLVGLIFLLVMTALIVIPFSYAVRFMVGALRARRDLAANAVTVRDGQILWDRNRYRPEITGQRAELIGRTFQRNRGTDLAPGHYRFGLLASSGWVIAAYPLETADAADVQGLLGSTLGFTSDDVAANALGTITPAQARKLRSGGVGSVLFGVIFVVVGVVAAVLGMTSGQSIFGALIALLVFGGAGALMIGGVLRKRAESQAGRAVALDGIVTKLEKNPSKGANTYWYVLGDKQFQVPQPAYNALLAGRPYRIYHTPQTSTLLSVVPLDENQAVS